MNPPNDDDSDFDADELFYREESALIDARAKVASCEYELARLAKKYPQNAALRPPDSEYTVADLRTDELNKVLGRINSALGLTGEEQDYWLKLWDYARANRGVAEDEFDGMTREKLAAIIEAGIPSVERAVKPADSAADPADSDRGTVNNAAIQTVAEATTE
jgi:hypothetical protein